MVYAYIENVENHIVLHKYRRLNKRRLEAGMCRVLRILQKFVLQWNMRYFAEQERDIETCIRVCKNEHDFPLLSLQDVLEPWEYLCERRIMI